MLAKRRSHRLAEIFRAPMIVALVTMLGLLSALLGDGLWDAASWIMLLLPILMVAYCHWRYSF